MEKAIIPAHIIRSLVVTFIALVIIIAGVFFAFRRQESPRDAEPKVEIDVAVIPDGWTPYEHTSYALAYPSDMQVTYDETFDVLSFFVSTYATEPVARIFPSRSVEEEVEQLGRISGSTVTTKDVYAEAIRLTRISLKVPNSAGGEDLIEYYMFFDELNRKTYSFKVDQNASWGDFDAVAQTLHTP